MTEGIADQLLQDTEDMLLNLLGQFRYILLETNLDIDQFLKSVYRYVQIGVHIRGYQDKNTQRFIREVCEVCEFYVDDENNAKSNIICKKTPTGQV